MFLVQHLWAHVRRRAHGQQTPIGGIVQLAQTEICHFDHMMKIALWCVALTIQQLGIGFAGKQDIVGLDVQVHNSGLEKKNLVIPDETKSDGGR